MIKLSSMRSGTPVKQRDHKNLRARYKDIHAHVWCFSHGTVGANLMQDWGHQYIPKQPLVIDGMGIGVRRVCEPDRFCNRGAFGVGLMEGSVQVWQQLVAHAQRITPCLCHRVPPIQLLRRTRCGRT